MMLNMKIESFLNLKFFPTKFALLSHALKLAPPIGLCLEFGTFQGATANHIALHLSGEDVLYTFDSLQGLPEEWVGWRNHAPKGYLSRKGVPPKLEPKAKLVVGWFDESLPKFLDEHKFGPVRFIHIDSDLYSSAMTVLTLLRFRLAVGTVIVFDEYHSHKACYEGEYKAWQEFVQKTGIEYEYLGFVRPEDARGKTDGFQAAVRIVKC